MAKHEIRSIFQQGHDPNFSHQVTHLINKRYLLLTFDDYCDDDDDGGAWKTMLVMENVVDAS